MQGKIAVVTGGTGGIGTAICQALCTQGAKVIAGYHKGGDHRAANEWQSQQKHLGYSIEVNYIDVADFASCETFVNQVNERYGDIAILVNNAGITDDVQLAKMQWEQWEHVLRTNLDSAFNVTRPIINQMIAQRYGRIINISSINGQKGQFGQTNYSAAKAGLHGFTKALALEVARKGITVNTISPGYIQTAMIDKLQDEIKHSIVAQIPVQRFGQPEEVAHAVTFLASDSSGFITGANLAINGGQYLA